MLRKDVADMFEWQTISDIKLTVYTGQVVFIDIDPSLEWVLPASQVQFDLVGIHGTDFITRYR